MAANFKTSEVILKCPGSTECPSCEIVEAVSVLMKRDNPVDMVAHFQANNVTLEPWFRQISAMRLSNEAFDRSPLRNGYVHGPSKSPPQPPFPD
ncbi:hypothetical protein NPIL_63391 [Nephila pilipes]|uniref:Uncharacterized protein n=1 Tax=Nephila pilipes TaxID=299642 RepID=A0A8X6T6V4_NEPPI|nr:hypothetical protein NPIL_63391 [Nephila pilipes]